MSKSIINYELFQSILHEFFTEYLVDKILDYMNENQVFIKNFENSEDAIWFSAKKLLPEDREICEVIAELPSNGRLFKEFGFYDQKANEWYKYSGERTIHVIAWKKTYD